jgi:hypothetical protein
MCPFCVRDLLTKPTTGARSAVRSGLAKSKRSKIESAEEGLLDLTADAGGDELGLVRPGEDCDRGVVASEIRRDLADRTLARGIAQSIGTGEPRIDDGIVEIGKIGVPCGVDQGPVEKGA